jgi:hypothetical protein
MVLVANAMTATNLTYTVAHVATETGFNFKDMQKSLNSLPKWSWINVWPLTSY